MRPDIVVHLAASKAPLEGMAAALLLRCLHETARLIDGGIVWAALSRRG